RLCDDVGPRIWSAGTYECHNYRPCTPDRTWSSPADTRTNERPCCSNLSTDPWQQYLTANSDRLSHFGRRMSLFLQTLVLRGILFRSRSSDIEEIQMMKLLTKYVV